MSFDQGSDTLFPFAVLVERVRDLRHRVAVGHKVGLGRGPALGSEQHQLFVSPGRQGLDRAEPVREFDAAGQGQNVVVVSHVEVGGNETSAGKMINKL